MPERGRRRLTFRELGVPAAPSRREFLKQIALGGGGLLIGGRFLVRQAWAGTEEGKAVYSMIVVDFNKCAGCRTCETACSSFNHKITVGGRELPGLGDPHLSNIRVMPFSPDVDIPVTCVMCKDAPCIEACPVEPDAEDRPEGPLPGREASRPSQRPGAVHRLRLVRRGLPDEAGRGDRPQPGDRQARADVHALRGRPELREGLPLRRLEPRRRGGERTALCVRTEGHRRGPGEALVRKGIGERHDGHRIPRL